MRSPALILLISLVLPALSSPIPQEGNEQIEKLNVSPSPTLPAATAAAVPTNASEPIDPALQAQEKPPNIDAEDGMKAGMGAAMGGIGQATQALSSLPLVGSLTGAAGGLGGRDLEAVEKRSPLLEALAGLPILGSALGGIGQKRARRQLYPKLDHLPDMGSNGVINLGQNSKVKRQLDILKSLPLVGSLGGLGGLGGLTGGKVKRQIKTLTSALPLGGLPGSLGGKVKRDPAFEALGELPGVASTLLKAVGKPNGKRQLDLVKDLPVVGGLVGGGLAPKPKRAELPLDQVKKMVAIVADIRGVTSKREAVPEAAPVEGDFRSGLREANKAKVGGELNKAQDKAERKVKIKNTKFPPGKVKSPTEALDKRGPVGLDALPVKDVVEGAAGLESTMELFKTVTGAVKNRNGK